jgi:hypothetical protein
LIPGPSITSSGRAIAPNTRRQPFAVCLTHDIDVVYWYALSKGYATLSSLKNGNFTKALASARQVSFVSLIESLNPEKLTQAAR